MAAEMSEAEYDALSARTFNRQVADARRRSAFGVQPAAVEHEPSWRTGPPGRLTEAESRGCGWLPPMHTHEQYREHQRKRAQAEETRRQIAAEQKTLRLASEHGWDWLRANTSGRDRELVESVRQRLGSGSASQLQEAAGAALLDAGVRTRVTESTNVRPTAVAGRRIRVTLITPGMGSSGWYDAAVLEQAAKDKVFPRGLHLFLDHPTSTESRERPERSVRDLAAVLTEDARWTGSALVAEADVLPAHAELVTSLEGVAGMSIRAMGDVEPAQMDGRQVRKITRLAAPAESVDFVTKAGRGGTYEVLESGRPSWGW